MSTKREYLDLSLANYAFPVAFKFLMSWKEIAKFVYIFFNISTPVNPGHCSMGIFFSCQ